MKLLVLSDIHNEFGTYLPDAGAVNEADVIVLAGDVDLGKNVHMWLQYAFRGVTKPILYVAGNHEYYRGDLVRTFRHMKEDFAEMKERLGLDVRLMENDAHVIGDVQFVGATLWTDYRLTGNQPLAMFDAYQCMNDFKLIRQNDSKIRPAVVQKLHAESRAYIEKMTSQHPKNVVITHHAPCELSIHPRYKDLDGHMNASYASDLTMLFGPHIPLWVHGHTHDSFDYEVAGTRVVCNPRGYHRQEMNLSFDHKLIVEV